MRSILLTVFLICASLLAGLALCSAPLAQEVAIYYDPARGTAWVDPAQLAPAVDEALAKKNMESSIVKTDALVTYMEANKEGIVVMTSGIVPGEIFQSKGDEDPLYEWLMEGGVMFWSGDWPFYYWGDVANCPAAQGEVSLFGVAFTQGMGPPGQPMTPTDFGKELVPSMAEHPSSRPVSLAVLENNKFEYESYADDGSFADPIALRTSKMEGWFVNFYTWPEDVDYAQVGLEMAELIENRFVDLVEKAVDKTGKMATTWGAIRESH